MPICKGSILRWVENYKVVTSGLHDLGGEAGHLVVLRRALQKDERAAGGFEVGEALLDWLGRADEAGLQAAVGDRVVAEGDFLLELRAGDPLLEVGEAGGRLGGVGLAEQMRSTSLLASASESRTMQ